jgi:hypothetical protein
MVNSTYVHMYVCTYMYSWLFMSLFLRASSVYFVFPTTQLEVEMSERGCSYISGKELWDCCTLHYTKATTDIGMPIILLVFITYNLGAGCICMQVISEYNDSANLVSGKTARIMIQVTTCSDNQSASLPTPLQPVTYITCLVMPLYNRHDTQPLVCPNFRSISHWL